MISEDHPQLPIALELPADLYARFTPFSSRGEHQTLENKYDDLLTGPKEVVT
jgi:hypothetical protein